MNSRKNIFQLVEENYNIKDECLKLLSLFKKEKYFTYRNFEDFTLEKLIAMYLFDNWEYKGTCISTDEFIKRAQADINVLYSQETAINFVEVMSNFANLYWINDNELYQKHKIQHYTNFDSVFCKILNELIIKLGLSQRKLKGKIVLYPKNISLERVVDTVNDEDVQWDLIKYVRGNISLTEKKKMLGNFATQLNIEQDKQEKDDNIKLLLRQTTNLLNNMCIRHPNQKGNSSEVLKQISRKDQEVLCDMIYDKILTICLLRDQKKYDEAYNNFNKIQKEVARK